MTTIIALFVVFLASASAEIDPEAIYLPPYIEELDGVYRECYDTFLDCELLTGDRYDRLKLSFSYGWSVRSIHPCWYEGDCVMFQEDRETVFDWVKIKILHRSRYLYIEEVTVTRECKNGQAFYIKSLATEAIYPDENSPTGYAYLVRVEELVPTTPVAGTDALPLSPASGASVTGKPDCPDRNGDGKVDILDFVKQRQLDAFDRNGNGKVDILDFVKKAPPSGYDKIAITWGGIKNRR